MQAPTFADSPVGKVFEIAGKLKVTKRLGIVLDVEGDTARVHLSPKEKDTVSVPVATLTAPKEEVPVSLSPAARLFYATRQPNGPIKASWDVAALSERASQVALSSMGTMRQLADEAISLGWDDILAWTTLTESEKVWRRAHQAASAGDLESLLVEIAKLPPAGYEQRVGLLWPLLQAVAAHEGARAQVSYWRELGLPGAAEMERLLGQDWRDALRAGADVLTARSPDRARAWVDALNDLEAGAPRAALTPVSPSWDMAAVVTSARAGANVDGAFARVAALPASILDDLIESGSLTDAADVGAESTPNRAYLLARLRPHELDDDAIASVGHHGELARRYVRRRDFTKIATLPATADVEHFRALLDVVDGKKPDAERLKPESVQLLELAARTLGALNDKATNTLPGPVANDPTLWTMFAEHARSGVLSLDGETRAANPDLAQWCDLQRLVGMVWDERWADAISLGEKLTAQLGTERQEDEALNLTAYALLRVGRGDDAIDYLERAIAGSYTEALLVNLSVAASQTQPDVAARHFARIVKEAPTRELQVAAFRRAIEVWQRASEDIKFPPELIEPMRTVLTGDLSIDDYARFTSVVAFKIPQEFLKLPAPTDARAPVYRLQKAQARFFAEPNFLAKDLAQEFVAVHKEVGRPDWFNVEWDGAVTGWAAGLFKENFGDAMGSAEFIDTAYVAAPELFTQHQKFMLVPAAGVHFAKFFQRNGSALNSNAFKKFFYLPIEEFLATRASLDPGAVTGYAEHFDESLRHALIAFGIAMRDSTSDPYNALVQRLGWDVQNRHAILQQMRGILGEDSANQEEMDRGLDRLRRLAVNSDEAREGVRVISEFLAEWRAETVRLRANL